MLADPADTMRFERAYQNLLAVLDPIHRRTLLYDENTVGRR